MKRGAFRRLGLGLLASAACLAQQAGSGEAIPTFGVTVVAPYGFCGRVYWMTLPKFGIGCSARVPTPGDFQSLKPVERIYATQLAVTARDFTEGFPGVGDERVEWFAINYTARFWVETPGKYSFRLLSDDGSVLYIDERRVIDNDCIHQPLSKTGAIELEGGLHDMTVSYFQGPRYQVALALEVKPPGQKQHWQIFNTDDFRPPANPTDWKYGNPDKLDTPADPCTLEPRKPLTTLQRRK